MIASKITIPTDGPRICRQGLIDTLMGNLESCHATVINGRAGTGKTMLAVDFVHRHVRRAAWYKVDATDISLPVFIDYMVASVARLIPGFGRQTLKLRPRSSCRNCAGGIGGDFDIAALAEAYIYDLERQAEHMVLVIDDLHLIYDAYWVIPFFHRLLPLLPAETHMLILGRGLPPSPMWRLRSKQRLSVITEQMLAFTQPEAEDLFSTYGLDAKEASSALKKTRGRADDLHAAAMLACAAVGSHAALPASFHYVGK